MFWMSRSGRYLVCGFCATLCGIGVIKRFLILIWAIAWIHKECYAVLSRCSCHFVKGVLCNCAYARCIIWWQGVGLVHNKNAINKGHAVWLLYLMLCLFCFAVVGGFLFGGGLCFRLLCAFGLWWWISSRLVVWLSTTGFHYHKNYHQKNCYGNDTVFHNTPVFSCAPFGTAFFHFNAHSFVFFITISAVFVRLAISALG